MSDQHDDEPARRPLTSAELLARRKQEKAEAEARATAPTAGEPAAPRPRPARPRPKDAPGGTRPKDAPAAPPRRDPGANPARTGANPVTAPKPAPRPRPRPAAGPSTVASGATAVGVGSFGAEEALAGSSVFGDGPPTSPPVTEVELAQAAYDANPRNWTRIRRRSGPLFRLSVTLLVLVVFAAVAVRTANRWIDRQIHPGDPGEEVAFTVEEGWTTNDIASELSDAGVVANAAIFRQYLSCPASLGWLLDCPGGQEYSFQAGQYVLAERMDFDAVIETLAAGPVVPDTEDLLLVTVREGLTLGQISDDLIGQLPLFSTEELFAAYLAPEVRWSLMPPEQVLVEGLLFPETYAVDEVGEQDELGLLLRMRQQFDTVVGELDIEGRAAALGVTPYEAVIIASLIEEEAKIDADRAKIAQVIYNRLESGWSLGIDASTRYAVGKPPGEPLTQSDLASDSPYNTRNPNVIGLPPTPIAAPGRASLEAALNPEEGPWMYYVLTDEGGVEGAHTFATTEAEFAAAVAVCRDLGYCG
jgi:UPF0755 protein